MAAYAFFSMVQPDVHAGIVDEVAALAPQRQSLAPTLIAAAARALAPDTVRAFLSDLRLWDRWCRRAGVPTSAAMTDTVAAYIRALSGQDVGSAAASGVEERSAATIGRYVVNIG